MAEGKIRWFNPDKGYGFIESESGEELFVRFSEIQSEEFKTLDEGMTVEFNCATSAAGVSEVEILQVNGSPIAYRASWLSAQPATVRRRHGGKAARNAHFTEVVIANEVDRRLRGIERSLRSLSRALDAPDSAAQQ